MQVADLYIHLFDRLTCNDRHHAQRSVRRRMRRTDIDPPCPTDNRPLRQHPLSVFLEHMLNRRKQRLPPVRRIILAQRVSHKVVMAQKSGSSADDR